MSPCADDMMPTVERREAYMSSFQTEALKLARVSVTYFLAKKRVPFSNEPFNPIEGTAKSL